MSTDAPAVIQLAVSFDWETLLPVLFLVLYGLAQFFGSRKKGAAAPEEAEEQEVDAEERARQIREEIRRRMEERRHAVQEPSSARPAYDPRLPESQQRRPQAEPARPVVAQRANPVFMPVPEPDIEQRLREQRRRLEEARQQQQEAQTRARDIERRAGVRRDRDARIRAADQAAKLMEPVQLRHHLVAGLREPNALRKAVLFREILGPPLGLQ